MPGRFELCFSHRRRFGRWAYLIAFCGLAAASVGALVAVTGAAKAESQAPPSVSRASPGKGPAPGRTPAPGRSFRDCSKGCPEMVGVAPGSFIMGAPAGEEERENWPKERRGYATPQHVVTIRYKFAIGKFDVTRDEYAQFVAETHRPDPEGCSSLSASGDFIATKGDWRSPGFPQTGRDPVVCV